MQDLKDHTSTSYRKPWYQRAIEMPTVVWKLFSKSKVELPNTKLPTLWKTVSNSSTTSSKNAKLKKSTSLKVATRVCLCAPLSFYNDVFLADAPPRRSYSYPARSKSMITGGKNERFPSARMSVEGRRIFRGKSLTDDVLMRRFVVEEEAMMQIRRRNQMDIIRKRAASRRKRIGPSPLSTMVLAEEDEQ